MERKISYKLISNPLIEIEFEIKCFSKQTNSILNVDYKDIFDDSILVYYLTIKEFGISNFSFMVDFEFALIYCAYCGALYTIPDEAEIGNRLNEYVIESTVPELCALNIKRKDNNDIYGKYNLTFVKNNTQKSIIVSYKDLSAINIIFEKLSGSVDLYYSGPSYKLSDATSIVAQDSDEEDDDISYIYNHYIDN